MPSATSRLELLSQSACAGGTQRFYAHPSETVGLPMRFGVFMPPSAGPGHAVPAILYLAGLTCNEETFFIKAGAQQFAAQHGVVLFSGFHFHSVFLQEFGYDCRGTGIVWYAMGLFPMFDRFLCF